MDSGAYRESKKDVVLTDIPKANWLALFERIAPYASSANTSKWIDGAMSGEILAYDIQQVESKLDRKERCRIYAQVMSQVFNTGLFEKEEDPGQLHQNLIPAL
ncbi:MAG: hypothetical protein R6V39_00530 [Desulfovibrionales bacterium]